MLYAHLPAFAVRHSVALSGSGLQHVPLVHVFAFPCASFLQPWLQVRPHVRSKVPQVSPSSAAPGHASGAQHAPAAQTGFGPESAQPVAAHVTVWPVTQASGTAVQAFVALQFAVRFEQQ
jgi:hypothetical protein